MATRTTAATADGYDSLVSFDLSGPWTTYWVVFLRLITGYWFFHAGLTKMANLWGGASEPFSAGWWLTGATQGTVVAPVTSWFGANAAWLVNFAVPAGELLIGLGLLLGALTRLAAFFGAFLMAFFYLGNAEWAHGFVNGDLMGLLLFVTVLVFGAGRVYGLDGYLESTDFVQRHDWTRYLLG